MSGRLEKLFARYRDRGDAGALAEVFDATAPELFRLAQHLVRDPLGAEDVLQDTFVAAIDAAPRWDSDRPLVPWLTGILARKASESRRRARRLVDPTRLDARGEPDPARTAEESEFSRELRDALAALPELYREVLERHLLAGARPAEIARDLARSPGAVRMQIFRGLEQLRRVLPAGFAAGAVLAAFAPRGLAAVREVVLAHAAAQGALAAAAGGTVAAGALGWKLGLACALALALAATGWYVRALVPDAPRALEAVSPTTAPPADVPALALQPAPRAEASRAVASQREPEAPRRVLRGRVAGPEAEARSAVALALRGVARYDWPEAWTLRAPLAADGSFAIDLDGLLALARERGALDALELQVDHPDWLPERVRIDADAVRLAAADARELELWVEVALRRAIVLAGRVERDGDGPAPHVGALPVRDGVVESRWLDRSVADADGRFRLRLPEPGEVEVVACAADTLADAERAWVAPGAGALARELRLAPGVRLEGTLVLPGLAGEIESTTVQAALMGDVPRMELAGRPLALRDGRWCVESGDAPVAPDGSFVIAGLERGAHWLSPRARSATVLVPYSEFERDVQLTAPVERLTFTLAAAGLDVRLVDAARAARAGTFELIVDEWPERIATHADGTRRVAVPPGALLQLAADSRAAVRELRAPAADQSIAIELTASAAPLPTLSIELALPTGAPDSINAALSLPGAVEPFEVRTLARTGDRLFIVQPPAEAFELELFVGGAHRHLEDGWLPARVAVPESGARATKFRLALERGARLRLVARDATGRALPLAARVFDLWGNEQPVRFLRRGSAEQGFTADGRLSPLGAVDVVPNLAPGLWTVEVVGDDGVAERRHVRLDAGQEVELEFTP